MSVLIKSKRQKLPIEGIPSYLNEKCENVFSLSLPSELLREICSHLNGKDLTNLEKVDKFFYRFVSPQWKLLISSKYPQYLPFIKKENWKQILLNLESFPFSPKITNTSLLKCPLCRSAIFMDIREIDSTDECELIRQCKSNCGFSYTTIIENNPDHCICLYQTDTREEIAGQCISCNRILCSNCFSLCSSSTCKCESNAFKSIKLM